jgi:hypothetical protein
MFRSSILGTLALLSLAGCDGKLEAKADAKLVTEGNKTFIEIVVTTEPDAYVRCRSESRRADESGKATLKIPTATLSSSELEVEATASTLTGAKSAQVQAQFAQPVLFPAKKKTEDDYGRHVCAGGVSCDLRLTADGLAAWPVGEALTIEFGGATLDLGAAEEVGDNGKELVVDPLALVAGQDLGVLSKEGMLTASLTIAGSQAKVETTREIATKDVLALLHRRLIRVGREPIRLPNEDAAAGDAMIVSAYAQGARPPKVGNAIFRVVGDASKLEDVRYVATVIAGAPETLTCGAYRDQQGGRVELRYKPMDARLRVYDRISGKQLHEATVKAKRDCPEKHSFKSRFRSGETTLKQFPPQDAVIDALTAWHKKSAGG